MYRTFAYQEVKEFRRMSYCLKTPPKRLLS